MNEIKKCSISGISFTLDKEAYARLEEYISSLKKAYDHNPDGAEIIADIEARIAELILSALSDAGQTVRKPLIENIIAQLGCAEDISGESAADEPIKSDTRIPRRLYRDVENAKLGGVCAGLGKYFDVDTVWIRLVPFLPLLMLIFCDGLAASIFGNLFGMFVISYIIMWFAVPSAKSARQKLEMNGEPVTVRSISENSSATPEETAKSSVASAVTGQNIRGDAQTVRSPADTSVHIRECGIAGSDVRGDIRRFRLAVRNRQFRRAVGDYLARRTNSVCPRHIDCADSYRIAALSVRYAAHEQASADVDNAYCASFVDCGDCWNGICSSMDNRLRRFRQRRGRPHNEIEHTGVCPRFG